MPVGPSESKVSEQFTQKLKDAASRGIWTILLSQATKFCKPAHQIWQNFPRKTVGPTDNE